MPAILTDAALTGPLGDDLDRERLATFADMRGIRIEDDVLCTQGDPEVLSSAVPRRADLVEERSLAAPVSRATLGNEP